MWILDNSIVVKWFFEDEVLHQKSIQVRNLALRNSVNFAVPTLIYSELIHVLSKKSKYDLPFVHDCIAMFTEMKIRTLPLSNEVLRYASEFTCQGFSGYDATYLALAKDLHGKWLTADLKAVERDNHQHSAGLNDF